MQTIYLSACKGSDFFDYHGKESFTWFQYTTFCKTEYTRHLTRPAPSKP